MKRKSEDPLSFNVLHEQVSIYKETVVSGKVVIRKNVHEENEMITVPVSHEEVKIKKVTINKYVDAAPEIRYEGETTIIPVIKEVLIVEKKLLLVEEVHVTKHVVTQTTEHTVPIRKEEVSVEHYTRNTPDNFKK
jgi:uncharacterized protein (TIGR02271 family)